MVPTSTGKLEYIFKLEKSTGKVGEFYPKYWKGQGIFASFFKKYFFSIFLMEAHLLNLSVRKYGNMLLPVVEHILKGSR